MVGSDVAEPSAEAARNNGAAPRADQDREVAAVDRVLKTICLLSCFLTLGLSSPLVGNTLVHLERLFDVSTATISITIIVQTIGYLFGAILCGFVFDRVNHELAFAFAGIIRGLSAVVAPFIGGLVPFIAAMGIHNISNGFVDASGQSYCVGLWTGHRFRDPLLQALHAVWSLGGTLGPFINARFLVDLPHQQIQQQKITSAAVEGGSPSLHIASNNDNLTTFRNLTSVETSTVPLETNDVYGVEDVCYAYVTIGSLILVANCLFVIAYFRDRFITKSTSSFGAKTPAQSPKDSINTNSMVLNVDSQDAENLSHRRASHSGHEPTGVEYQKLDK